MADFHERLRRSLEGRPLIVDLSEGLEQRLRLHIDRVNPDFGDYPLDPDDDADLACALLACAEWGVECSEREAGLQGMVWGELISAEVADEGRRRRRHQRWHDEWMRRMR